MDDEQDYEAKPERSEDHIVATPHTLVISLSDENQKRAQECLRNSGSISFSLREVAVTRLPAARLADGVEVD